MTRTRTLRLTPTLTPHAAAAAVLAALACSALTGCYERVVGAKGLGSDRIETQEPYQQDSEIDRWFYGDKPQQPPR